MGSLLLSHFDAGSPWKPAQQYITVRDAAVILGFSDDYVRNIVVALFDEGILLPMVDLLEVKPRRGAIRNVRKQYRQFRIHKDTGLDKIKAYLAPQRIKS